MSYSNQSILKRYFSKKSRPPKPRFVPPELWINVFDRGGLGSADMANVRLTCHTFAALGRSQAFHTFEFSPFILSASDITYRHSFTDDVVARRKARLAFWTSDDIAPLVRRCRLHATYLSDKVTTICNLTGQSLDVFDEFIEVFPTFVNVFYLEFQHMPFDEYALSQLATFQHLTTLVVQDCSVEALHCTPIRIPTVCFCSFFSGYGIYDVYSRLGWLDILDPAHFRSVELSFHQPEISHLRGIATESTMSELSDPSIPEVDTVHLHMISILSRSTALEELRIASYKSGHTEILDPPNGFALGSLSLPSLRLYSGPHQFLSWFVPGPHLRTMTLLGSEKYSYTAPEALLGSLQHLDGIGTEPFDAETLTIWTHKGLPDVLLRRISPRFPHLKHLNLRASRVDEVQVCCWNLCSNFPNLLIHIPKLIKSITTCLPQDLETLSLDLRHVDPHFTRVGWIRRGLPLRSELFKRYPSLRHASCTYCDEIWVCDWRRGARRGSKMIRGLKSAGFVCFVLAIEDI